jgi:choline dehydrogenase-like flavoprotein
MVVDVPLRAGKLPAPPSVNTNATVYAIAERAADLIRASASKGLFNPCPGRAAGGSL